MKSMALAFFWSLTAFASQTSAYRLRSVAEDPSYRHILVHVNPHMDQVWFESCDRTKVGKPRFGFHCEILGDRIALSDLPKYQPFLLRALRELHATLRQSQDVSELREAIDRIGQFGLQAWIGWAGSLVDERTVQLSRGENLDAMSKTFAEIFTLEFQRSEMVQAPLHDAPRSKK